MSIAPWDGKERLNILLIGADEQGGGHNTDTLITVSIDPVTKQVAMFSLPRDTVDVPIPQGPARQVWGRGYGGKINSFFANNRHRSDLWSGNDRTRGYNALKSVLGELYDLDIKYFVEVNFEGFQKVVDAVGGVTINVQIPVSDDRFPGERGKLYRLYIPTGIQHMDGAQALKYARSRHSSTDFDRGQRQQRVLLSLREQADPQNLIPKLPELIAALKKTVRTDVPLDQMDELLGLASEVDTKNIRSYVFAPPLYSQRHLLRPARLRRHPEHPADQGGRQGRLHRGPGRRGAAPDAGRRGRRRLGPQRHERLGPRLGPGRLPRLPRRRRIGPTPAAGGRRPVEHADRRLQRRRGHHARDDRLPREDVRDEGQARRRPGRPDRHRHHDRQPDPEARGPSRGLTERARPAGAPRAGARATRT